MDTIKIFLHSLGDTENLGFLIGSQAEPCDVICLEGELGTGKTTLTQAIARGLGVAENNYITSPSFAILHEYQGRIPLYHMDFYRLHDASEVEELGFEEYFYLGGLTVIEWPNRAKEILPDQRMIVEINRINDITRTVTLSGDKRYAKIFNHIGRKFPRENYKSIIS